MNLIVHRRIVGVVSAFLLAVARLAADSPAPTAILPPAPVVIKLSAEQTAAFHKYLVAEQKQLGLPGLAVVLVQPGQTLLIEGLGVRQTDGNLPVTSDTRFALGPATQAVNSLLLARLAEEDVLSLDGAATRCWDEFKLAESAANVTLPHPAGMIAGDTPERIDNAPATRAWDESKPADRPAPPKVTMRQLLEMTAGLPGRIDGFLGQANSTPENLFALLAQTPVTAPPGREFAYSDASVAAAGFLAVYAANKHHAPEAGLVAGYAALAKKELFDPLGMKDAAFEVSADDATGHTRDAQGGWKVSPTESAAGGALRPALGLRASASDVATWLQLEIADGIGRDGKSFVLANAVEERWRPASADDKREYAMGWATQHYRGIEIVTREGEYDHQAELVAIIPQYRTAFALLTNGSGKETAVFLQDALLNLADLLHETAAEQP